MAVSWLYIAYIVCIDNSNCSVVLYIKEGVFLRCGKKVQLREN